jgi:hypothetical protein
MMELYIQIRNGQPFEHPIFGDNFRQAFPDVDVNNLPTEFAKFERVPQNVMPDVFEVAEVRYEWFDDIVKDVWSVRPMIDQEKANKIAEYRANLPFPSWTLDETTLQYSAPTPKPDDGKIYRWDEATLSWVVFVPPSNTA